MESFLSVFPDEDLAACSQLFETDSVALVAGKLRPWFSLDELTEEGGQRGGLGAGVSSGGVGTGVGVKGEIIEWKTASIRKLLPPSLCSLFFRCFCQGKRHLFPSEVFDVLLSFRLLLLFFKIKQFFECMTSQGNFSLFLIILTLI